MLALVVGSACGDDDGPVGSLDAGARRDATTSADAATNDAPDTTGTSMMIGAGVTTYEPIEDGAALTLVMGPQGGYHVELTFRACGLEAEDARLRVAGFDALNRAEVAFEIDRVLTSRRVRLDESGCWIRVGDLLVFDVTVPAEIVGRDVRVEAQVVAADGTSASATKRIRVVE